MSPFQFFLRKIRDKKRTTEIWWTGTCRVIWQETREYSKQTQCFRQKRQMTTQFDVPWMLRNKNFKKIWLQTKAKTLHDGIEPRACEERNQTEINANFMQPTSLSTPRNLHIKRPAINIATDSPWNFIHANYLVFRFLNPISFLLSKSSPCMYIYLTQRSEEDF